MRKAFFYIHTNIVTKKWGEQNARNNFSRNTFIVQAKNVWEKIVGKSEKNVVLYSHKYRYKKTGGKKRAKQFFQKHKNSTNKICWEKIVGKKWENVFLYSHEYRDQEMGEKKRAKQFFQKHTNSASKKCWGKNRRKKVRKAFFYIHTYIVTKKWGGKTRETIFPETQD